MSKQHVGLARELLNYLVKNQFDKLAPYYDPALKAAFGNGDKLAQAWQKTIDETGPIKNVISIKPTKVLTFTSVSLSCECAKSPLSVQFAFDSADRLAGVHFFPGSAACALPSAPYHIPPYADPTAFKEHEIVVGSGKWLLNGKLTIPEPHGATNKFPCVVLVHGSGSHDEDETIGPNKTFKDIAFGLSSRNIAVLRYTKRSKQYAETMTEEEKEDLTLMEETIIDAVAAVDAAIAHESIDKGSVFVLGHSLGGYAIPMIGKMCGDKVNGLISLAGSMRNLCDMILDQLVYIKSLREDSSNIDIDIVKAAAEKIKDPTLPLTTPKAELLNIPARYWQFLREYDPLVVANETPHPILVLHAGRDYQVTEKDLALWKQVGPSPRLTVKEYVKLNHLMINTENNPAVDISKRATPEEYAIKGTFDEEVINDISSWIQNHTTTGSNSRLISSLYYFSFCNLL